MMTIVPKLTTVAACRVARLDRALFNGYVHSGDYPCAPQTVPGRARFFDPDDLLALRLFRDLMDDGYSPKAAGRVACLVGRAAKEKPEANVIAFVETYVGQCAAYPASEVLPYEHWEDTSFSGATVRKVTMFNVAQIRRLNDQGTEEERSIIGPDDPEV